MTEEPKQRKGILGAKDGVCDYCKEYKFVIGNAGGYWECGTCFDQRMISLGAPFGYNRQPTSCHPCNHTKQ